MQVSIINLAIFFFAILSRNKLPPASLNRCWNCNRGYERGGGGGFWLDPTNGLSSLSVCILWSFQVGVVFLSPSMGRVSLCRFFVSACSCYYCLILSAFCWAPQKITTHAEVLYVTVPNKFCVSWFCIYYFILLMAKKWRRKNNWKTFKNFFW